MSTKETLPIRALTTDAAIECADKLADSIPHDCSDVRFKMQAAPIIQEHFERVIRTCLDAVEKEFPDIGQDPLQHDDWATHRSTKAMKERIMQAMSIQQKEVPDQTALVWRIDISQLHQEHSQQAAYIKSLQDQLTQSKEANAELLKALRRIEAETIGANPHWIMNFARQAIDAAVAKGT